MRIDDRSREMTSPTLNTRELEWSKWSEKLDGGVLGIYGLLIYPSPETQVHRERFCKGPINQEKRSVIPSMIIGPLKTSVSQTLENTHFSLSPHQHPSILHFVKNIY